MLSYWINIMIFGFGFLRCDVVLNKYVCSFKTTIATNMMKFQNYYELVITILYNNYLT